MKKNILGGIPLFSIIFISSLGQIMAQSSSVEPSKIMTPLLGVGSPTFLTGEKFAVKSGTTQFGVFPGYLDNVANPSWTTLDIQNVSALRVWDHFSVSNNVGIGTTSLNFPLNFASSLGDKISLWGSSGNHVGFGIQPSLLQIHTDVASADIAFGHGTSATFTENMRIKGNGNVGIGMSPTMKLDVAGEIRGSGFTGQFAEMRVDNFLPYIDFSNDNVSDFDARMILLSNDELTIEGANLTVQADVTISGKINNEAYMAPTLLNGWVNYNVPAGFATAAYYKDKESRVQLKGLLRSGTFTSGTILFNLPAAYRPSEIMIYAVVNGSSFGRVDVYPNGDVKIVTGGNDYVSLDGITFRALQ